MKRTKSLVLALSAVLLVAATVVGTVAYLTDEAEVVNTFTVGKVELKLEESVTDKNGVVTGGKTEQGNEYHLVPGMSYVKDPAVTVLKDSEEAYVRMLVTLNCYSELKAIFGEDFLPQYFVEGWDNSVWQTTGVVSVDGNNATYEFRYQETVKKNAGDTELEPLFQKINVPGELTGAQMATIAGLKITVEAHAIQAVGFADADDAWGAFTK